MPSLIGHSLASLSLCSYRSDARSIKLLICAQVAGIAPDFDIIVSYALGGDPLALHQLYTHNAFFPMLVAMPLAWISGRNLRSWLFFSAMGWIHCFLDALIGWPLFEGNTRGVPFFFPILGDFVPGTLSLFPPVYYSEEHGIWDIRNLLTLLFECAVFGALSVFVWIRRLLGYNRPSNFEKTI